MSGSLLQRGDCIERMGEMREASVDAIVTDPPYALPGGFMSAPWDRHDGREDAGLGYWLAGLIDGEGCFTIKAHTRGTHAPMFSIHMRADEEGTLRLVQRELGIGSITREERDPNAMVRWNVQSKSDCQRLVDLLDKYPLRAKKRMDYEVWREAVCEWSGRRRGNRWHGAADNGRMAALRDRLMSSRRYVEPAWSGHEFQDWCRLWATEALRVLKPGGHMLVFGGTRTWYRMAAGLEDAGFELRDTLMWLYASGFPKSMNAAVAIDKALGAPPRGRAIPTASTRLPSGRYAEEDLMANPVGKYEAQTEGARGWEGWGTALKPAWEPVVVARKPLDGTVAANLLEHGVGALNIDGCRIDASGGRPARQTDPKPSANGAVYAGRQTAGAGFDGGSRAVGETTEGRWPANLILSHAEDCVCVGERIVRGDSREGGNGRRRGGFCDTGADSGTREPNGPLYSEEVVTRWACVPGCPVRSLHESGGASRFFYCAKATAGERDAGLGGFERHDNAAHRHADGRANSHPTVKPLGLMRWLVRLVTPPDGVVLDPFCGSGTTGCAAVLEGFRFVGIEQDPEYARIAETRVAWWAAHPEGLAPEAALAAERQRARTARSGQLSLEDAMRTQ